MTAIAKLLFKVGPNGGFEDGDLVYVIEDNQEFGDKEGPPHHVIKKAPGPAANYRRYMESSFGTAPMADGLTEVKTRQRRYKLNQITKIMEDKEGKEIVVMPPIRDV